MAEAAKPPEARPEGLPSLMIVYNGTTAGKGGIGGGDQVILKFIRLSGFVPDLIVPSSATSLISPHGRLWLTMKSGGSGLLAMLWLYGVRTLQGMFCALRIRERYDVVLGVSAIAVDLLPLWLTPGGRKGVIIYHLLPDRKAVNWETRIRFWLAAMEHKLAMRLVAWTCDFVVAGNEVTKRELELLLPGKEVVVLHAGFNADAIDAVPEVKKDPKLACFMGRLTSQKGIFDLLDVMEEINREEPDFRLVMLGGGPERESLAREIERRGLRTVELAGFVTDEQKYAVLRKAGFFFFPSYEEGWGIALAEALYCRARCVCYELPHYRGIFGDFPAYSELGDTRQFVRRFRERQGSGDDLEAQVGFVRRYHDPCVVRDLVDQLRRFASLPAK